MAFITVERDTLFTDILKTWVTLLKNTEGMQDVIVRVDTPDTDKTLKLPCVVVKRIGKDEWTLRRNSGNFGTKNSTESIEKRLYGYTYTSMFQFDIMTTTTRQNNAIQGSILKALQPERMFSKTRINLKHYELNTDSDTDLVMDFDFHKDVDGSTISSFDPNLHQHSISVKFDMDYLSEVEVEKIQSMSHNYGIV